MNILNWVKTAIATVKAWVIEKGLENVGWLVAFALAYTFFRENSLFYNFGFVALGIFIEKNRRQLVSIFKEIRDNVRNKIS